MPKISIILPVYNVEQYLRQCLDSIVQQTLEDIEIICIDDCSTDGSLKILEEYAAKDGRFIIIKQKRNKGQGIARNIGIKRAKGKYVCFVDPDDWIDTTMCEKMYKQAKKLKSDIVMCEFKRYREDEDRFSRSKFLRNTDNDYNVIYTKLPPNENLDYNLIKNILLISPCFSFNKIYNLNFIKSFDIKFSSHRCYEDVEFILKAFINTKAISYTNKRLYFYRLRNSSTLRALNNRFDILILVIANIKNILVLNDVYDTLKHNFEYFIIANIRTLKNKLSFWQIIKYYITVKKYLGESARNVLKQDLYQDMRDCVPTTTYEKFNKILEFISSTIYEPFNKIRECVFLITYEKTKKKKYKVIRLFGIKIKFKQK